MSSFSLDIKVPTWNECYRIARNRMYKTAEAKAFQEIINLSYKGELFDDSVEVEIEFHRSPLIDVDNCLKMLLDALEGKAYHKDRQVKRVTVARMKCAPGDDWLFVSVEPLFHSQT